MLTIVHDADLSHAAKIGACDPFQQSAPAWLVPPLLFLPPEHVAITIEDKEKHHMPIRFVEEKDAPIHVRKGGTISASAEWSEAMNAFRSLPAGKAIVLSITSDDLKKIKKPEVSVAYAFRRYFATNALMATAYQSGPMEVTIRRAKEAPKPKPRKK